MSAREPVIDPRPTTKVQELEKTMKRLKFITLALVAAFAISVVASASAALPELTKAGSTEALTKKKFTGTSGAGKFETEKGTKVECLSDTSSGEVEGTTKFTKVVVKFKGCKEPAFGVECKTAGAAKEEMVTKELVGKLGYLKKGT